MTWPEYERHAKGYAIREAREWERIRFLTVTILNMFAEKGKTIKPQEFLPLLTDSKPNTASSNKIEETHEEFWQRMMANNFYQKK